MRQTMTDNTETVVMHKFEAAGLGKAPFSYVGCEEKTIKLGDGTVRASGSCDYCGACIRYAFYIQSSDGKTSKVGCDCIEKMGDEGLRKYLSKIESAAKMMKMESQDRRDKTRIAKAVELLESHFYLFSWKPHPSNYWNEKGRNFADYIWFLIGQGGRSGRIDACKMIEKTVAEKAETGMLR